MKIQLHITSYHSNEEEGFWGYQINDDVIQIQRVKNKDVINATALGLLHGLEHIEDWFNGINKTVEVYTNDPNIYEILKSTAPIVNVIYDYINLCSKFEVGVVEEDRFLDKMCREFSKE